MQAFAAGMPAKLVVQTDDLLEPSPIGSDILISGLRNRQLTSTAIGSGASYVLQASASSLFQLREQIVRGLAFAGPALFSVFSGASGAGIASLSDGRGRRRIAGLPGIHLRSVGGRRTGPSRFSLAANSQLDLDWPVQRLDYEDADQQLVSETLAFTAVDFAACDPRCAKYFAKVPREKWNADMVPVSEFLAREPKDLTEKVPCLLMVDRDNRLQKVIVNDKTGARGAPLRRRVAQPAGARRRSQFARRHPARTRTQSLGGAGASRRPKPTARRCREPPACRSAGCGCRAPAVAEAAPEKSSDEPYIETPRCTTCNECTQINDKMFGYDANKQASIINPDAGTYRQLVEAAESCQVSIIHPGKPRNPNEPGLDELIKRAEPFL